MVQAFGPEAEAYIRAAGNKYYVNLKNMNALALRRAGVENIEISEECTMCNPDKYWSHRYTQGLRGSQGAVICCKGGIG
jgi:copper oxidase (laccase) domain-containing protein